MKKPRALLLSLSLLCPSTPAGPGSIDTARLVKLSSDSFLIM